MWHSLRVKFVYSSSSNYYFSEDLFQFFAQVVGNCLGVNARKSGAPRIASCRTLPRLVSLKTLLTSKENALIRVK